VLSGKPIRVCHLASGDLWAGAEVQVATVLSSLVKQSDLEISAVVLNEGRLARELRKCGVDITVIDENNTGSLGILKKLRCLFKDKKVDILHTHRYKENILGGLAAELSGIRHIVRTVHGLSEPFTGLKRINIAVYDWLNDFLARHQTDKIVAVSFEMADVLSKKYGRERVVCIHNAINLGRIKLNSDPQKLREELQISKADRIMGTVCRLTPIKGIEFFLKAASIIADKRSDVKFLIVGDGPLQDSLKRLSKELGVEKLVRFLGQREDVYDLINIMDVFVLSSLHEGLPTALLEALAMGKPVVATRVGGIPEVIKQDGLGILIEPKKPEQIAEACLTLLNNPVDDYELKLSRRHYAAREFSSESAGQKVVELYKELINKAN
jgi:glycosyltransferase involved in cell wall biosynthesis